LYPVCLLVYIQMLLENWKPFQVPEQRNICLGNPIPDYILGSPYFLTTIVILLDNIFPSSSEILPAKTSSISTDRLSVILLQIQLFRYSSILIVSALKGICSYKIIYCILEKTYSESADIASIKRISIAIFDKYRYCSCLLLQNYQISSKQSIGIGIYKVYTLYLSILLIVPTISSS
jgi:hypothetical protein